MGLWTDDTYLLVLPPGQAAVKLNIKLTTLNELHGVIYEVTSSTTTIYQGFSTRLPPVTFQEVRIYVWNCRVVARVSFRPNLLTMICMAGSSAVVLIDTRVGSRNERRLLNEVHEPHYYYRGPLGFVSGVGILWGNSKVEVCT